MKKTITFLLLFLGAYYAQAQIDTKVFTLDLGKPHKGSLRVQIEDNDTKKDSTPRLVIKTRELLAFNLVNGNPYKYSYIVNHRLVNFFEGQGYNALDSVAKMIKTSKANLATNDTSNADTSNEDRIKNINQRISDLTIKNSALQNKILQKAFINNSKANLQRQIDANNTIIADLKSQIAQLKSSYSSKSILSSKFITTTNLKYSLKTAKAIPATSEEDDIKNINNAIILLKQSFDDLSIDLNNFIAEIATEDFLDSEVLKEKRESFNASYITLLKNLQEINSEAVNFPDMMNDFNQKVVPITTLSKTINDEIKKMYQLKLYNYLLPLDSNGKNIDAVEVTVERYHKASANPTPDTYTYTVWVKGGLKIDVSGGLFVTSLLDQEYETRDVQVTTNGTTETQKAIYEKNQGDYDFGFGSSINLSLRGGSWVRPALSVGALFTANQKFQILAGGGLILGKEERIVLHGGLTMGAVTTIADGYATDGSTSYDLGTNGTVPTSNKFSFGHFFGITYNFGKVKKQNSQPNQ